MEKIHVITEKIKTIDNYQGSFTKREIKELPSILMNDEHLENLVEGFYDNGTGVLFLTNQRLIFVDKGILGHLKVKDFKLNNISSIEYNTGFVHAEIKIFASGSVSQITMIQKKNVKPFVDSVLKLMQSKSEPEPELNSEDDFISKLERLSKLKHNGSITQAEFEQAKSKLLSH